MALSESHRTGVYSSPGLFNNRTDLVKTALSDGLQELVGLFWFMSGYDSSGFSGQGLTADQHHHVDGLLEKSYFCVFILQDTKKV